MWLKVVSHLDVQLILFRFRVKICSELKGSSFLSVTSLYIDDIPLPKPRRELHVAFLL